MNKYSVSFAGFAWSILVGSAWFVLACAGWMHWYLAVSGIVGCFIIAAISVTDGDFDSTCSGNLNPPNMSKSRPAPPKGSGGPRYACSHFWDEERQEWTTDAPRIWKRPCG